MGRRGNTTNFERVSIEDNIVEISCGAHHTIALASNGGIYAFGSHMHGQLGIGFGKPVNYTPKRIEGLIARQVSAGDYHTAAISTDRTVFVWGSNKFGA